MEKIDIDEFGDYRVGLTNKEVDEYLLSRYNYKNGRQHKKCPAKIKTLFAKIAGINTMTVSPQGETLMYRYDVLRFADVLFDCKKTYFD